MNLTVLLSSPLILPKIMKMWRRGSPSDMCAPVCIEHVDTFTATSLCSS